jgi:hypothetical protein
MKNEKYLGKNDKKVVSLLPGLKADFPAMEEKF